MRIRNHLHLVVFLMALLLSPTVFGQERSATVKSRINPNASPNVIVVKTVTVDFTTNSITIKGENFGTVAPTVKIAGNQLVVESFESATQTIVAFLPGVLSSGTYLLTVSTGSSSNQTSEFDITIGAVGPQGLK